MFYGLQSTLLLLKIRSPGDVYFSETSSRSGKSRNGYSLACIGVFDSDGLVFVREVTDYAFGENIEWSA